MAAVRSENNFDIIRLVAAIMVIVTHSYALLGKSEHDLLWQLTLGTLQFSHLGVAVFFVISGYLISQSAFASKTWKGYLWRRVLRIFPGLLVVLLCSTFVLGAVVTNLPWHSYFTRPDTYLHLVSISLYRLYLHLPGVFENNSNTAVNGSLWTLAYEFTMYLVVIVAYLLGILQRKNVIAVLWLFMLAIRIYVGSNYFVYSYSASWLLGLNITYFFEWSFYFLTGTLVFLFREKINFNLKVLAAMLLLYIAVAFFKQESVLRIFTYLLVPYAIFTLAFIKSTTNNFGKYGDFSYGFYIYAFPVQQTIVHVLGAQIGIVPFFLLSVGITFPLAYASWHLVERRFLAFKNMVR